HVYALIETTQGMLWDSKDQGDHWTKVSDFHGLSARPFYFSLLHVSPADDRKLFFSSYLLLRSDDGGKTTTPIDRGVHVDHHALWIDPLNPDRMIQGNDGGAYVTETGAKSWRYLNNLPIEQCYRVAAALHRALSVDRERDEARHLEVPLQLDLAHHRVTARREHGVHRRQRRVQDHGRGRALDGAQSRSHAERQGEAGDERRPARVR